MKNKIIISVVVALVVVLVGGVAALAFNVWNPSWNPFQKNSLTIESAIAKTLNHKTYKVDSTVEFRLKGDFSGQKVDVPIKVKVSNVVDRSVKDSPLTLSKVKIAFDFQGIDFSNEGEGIVTKKAVYFRITKVPPLISGFIPIDKDKWYKTNINQNKQDSKDSEKAKEISKEIIELVKGKKIFDIEKKYGKEKIGNYQAVHYLVGINKKSAKVLIPQIVRIASSYLPKNEGEDIETEMKEFNKDFNKDFEAFWQKIQPLNFNFWLKDGQMVAFSFDKVFDISDLYKGENATQQVEVNQMEVKIKEVYSDFDKKVNIEIPKNVEEF